MMNYSYPLPKTDSASSCDPREFYPDPKPPKRWVNREYIEMVYGEPCLFWKYHLPNDSRNVQPGPPHHVRWASECGGSQKPDDFLTISTCIACHDALHSMSGPWFEAITRRVGREEIKAEIIRLMKMWIKRKFKSGVTVGFMDLFWGMGETQNSTIYTLGEWIREH